MAKKQQLLTESHQKTLVLLKVLYWVMLINPIIYSLIAWLRVRSLNTVSQVKATMIQNPLQVQSNHDDVYMMCAGIGFSAAIIALVFYRQGTQERSLKKIKHKEQHFMKVMLVTWVLFEICAASGMALCFISMQLSDMTPFMVVALLGIMSHPPSKARMRRIVFA